MEKIKPKTTKKFALESLDTSQVNFLAFLDYQKSNAGIQIRDYYFDNSSQNLETGTVDWNPDEKSKPCNFGKK